MGLFVIFIIVHVHESRDRRSALPLASFSALTAGRLTVLLLIRDTPEISFKELRHQLNDVLETLHANAGSPGDVPTISASSVSRLLHQMDYSWVVPIRFQRRKYTPANVEHYLHYVDAVQEIDFNRLKFLDEVHFVSKGAFLLHFLPSHSQRTTSGACSRSAATSQSSLTRSRLTSSCT
jgi:hypothetical protein